METTRLLEPVLTNGLRSTHFFNGRVLTAQDLRTDQEAGRDRGRRLARALGEGVAHGLEVGIADAAGGQPLLRIEAGLGFNRNGDAVELRDPVALRLVTPDADVPP